MIYPKPYAIYSRGTITIGLPVLEVHHMIRTVIVGFILELRIYFVPGFTRQASGRSTSGVLLRAENVCV